VSNLKSSASSVKFERMEGTFAAYSIGSGNYRFVAKQQPKHKL